MNITKIPVVTENSVLFRIWAPDRQEIKLVLSENGKERVCDAMEKSGDFFSGEFKNIGHGTLYKFLVDGNGPFPDPFSSFQPSGVHGPSEIIDHSLFLWTDQEWKGLSDNPVIYELHTGAFNKTFSGITDKLDYLCDLGINVIEIMPISDFPGRWNWGYDGVSLFAPARCYGRPEDLKNMICEAHKRKIAVILDVVYNHLGVDGNYLGVYSGQYFSKKHRTPWGEALDFDSKNSGPVREMVIENALFWLKNYHFDGFRFDAIQMIRDDSDRHILKEIIATCRKEFCEKKLLFIAEDDRNLSTVTDPQGLGFDMVWNDDFHHQLRSSLTGEKGWYFRDFSGKKSDLAQTVLNGFYFTGQYSHFFQKNRGEMPKRANPQSLVCYIQNHDQTGNRPFGNRITTQITPEQYQAISFFWLMLPYTPMLFCGQEWAAGSPFLFFSDHKPEIAEKVRKGRREMFYWWECMQKNPDILDRIPAPDDEKTFLQSCLSWSEIEDKPQSDILEFYKRIIQIRKKIIVENIIIAGVSVKNDCLTAVEMKGLKNVYELFYHDGDFSETVISANAHLLAGTGQYEQCGEKLIFTGPAAVVFSEENRE